MEGNGEENPIELGKKIKSLIKCSGCDREERAMVERGEVLHGKGKSDRCII